MDFLCEDVHEDFVGQTPETVGDISLDEPLDAFPAVCYFTEGCMASPSWAKPVGMIAEARLEVGVKDLTHHFLQHLR